MTAYFISGLGADERAFQRIVLPDFITVKHLKWIVPLRNEKLNGYVARMATQINSKDEFVLIGLSFGGLIAIELSKIISPKRIILISSFKERNQLRSVFKFIGTFKLNLLIPGKMLKKSNFIVNWLFTVQKRKDKDLLGEILKDSSPWYLYWSVNQILNWQNKHIPKNLYHIHGEKDQLLPFKKVQPDKIIQGAGHLMVLTHSGEVSKCLREVLGSS